MFRLRQRCCRLSKGGCRLREEGEGQAFQDETHAPGWRTVVPRPLLEKEFGDSGLSKTFFVAQFNHHFLEMKLLLFPILKKLTVALGSSMCPVYAFFI